MAGKRKRNHVITERAQRAALTSPVRMQLLETLGAIGPAPVRRIAERLGRSTHAVHYHVRRLLEIGLIRRTGSGKSGPRDEAIYDVIANRFEINIESASSASVVEFETKTVRAILRRAERDFSNLAMKDPSRLDGPTSFTGRMSARLPAGASKDVMRHVNAIQRIFTDELARSHPPQTKLEPCHLTLVFLPDAHWEHDAQD